MHLISQGFPDPIQCIGYELFEAVASGTDSASMKTFEHVLKKVTTVIKKEEFHSVETRIPDAKSERLLLVIALSSSEYVTTTELSARLSWPEEECRAFCLLLSDLQFLEHEGRKGFRFLDPLFRVYLNMLDVQREANIRRAEIQMQISKLSSGDFNSQARQAESEKILAQIIVENYRKTGRSGLWG
jgi:hypothetical protein